MMAKAPLLHPTDPLLPQSYANEVNTFCAATAAPRRIRQQQLKFAVAVVRRAAQCDACKQRFQDELKFEALGRREPVPNTHLTCLLLRGAAAAWRLLPPLINWNQMRKCRTVTNGHTNQACSQRQGLLTHVLIKILSVAKQTALENCGIPCRRSCWPPVQVSHRSARRNSIETSRRHHYRAQ